MKRFLIGFVLMIFLSIPGLSWGAAGTCVQELTEVYAQSGISPVAKVLKFTCTGGTGAETGAYPATNINTRNMNELKSWYLYKGETNPGAVPPEDNWDFTVTNHNTIDMFGGAGANRHTTTSQRVKPLDYEPVYGTWTLNISGNTTASAVIVLELTFVR